MANTAQSWLRPQSVVFTLLAEQLLGRELALFSGSFIEVLGRLGVTEHATRSTLARMTSRGLLEGHRRGRKMYFAMTPRCAAILEDGRRRIWDIGAVNAAAAEDWTLLTFSLPEAWRNKRYELRTKLTWAGFGPMQNGAWLAPATVDARPIIEELALERHVRAFRIRPVAPTDPVAIVRETFDLDALAERYRAFVTAWRKPAARAARDPLVLTLRLSTQWLRIIRYDPRVPLRYLPADWPAIEAQALYRTLHGERRKEAAVLAREVLDTVELND